MPEAMSGSAVLDRTSLSVIDSKHQMGLFSIDQKETTMEETKLGVIESRFAELIWAHAPLTSGELVKLCQEELTWKKSTTYTCLLYTSDAADE